MSRKHAQAIPGLSVSGSVPYTYHLRGIARQWGVPPWVVACEEPTPAVVSRWVIRERIFSGMES